MVLHFERFATIFKRDSDSYSRAFKLEFCIAIFGGFRTFYTAMVMVDKIKKHANFFFYFRPMQFFVVVPLRAKATALFLLLKSKRRAQVSHSSQLTHFVTLL